MSMCRAALAATFIALFLPATALAHAKMQASVPQDGAEVPAGLAEIEMSFSKPLRVTVVHLTRSENEEIPITGGIPKSFASTVKLAVAPLSAGSYEVSWTAVADDGHVMRGHFGFTVTEVQSARPSQ